MVSSPSDTDDKTVEFEYGAAGRTKTKAKLTGGGEQVTENVFGITTGLHSNDILKEVRYPDASTGASSGSEKDAYTHNQLGEVVTATDRNGNVHTYWSDILGRFTSDAVTSLGSGVDGAIRRIEVGYNTQMLAYQFTTYDAASSGNVVNQVQQDFNGLMQLTKEWQAVNGAVNTSTSPKVEYGYSFNPAGSTNHSRLTDLTYPNGRNLNYNYASGLSSDISRLSSISDGATTLEAYEYLGFNRIVQRAHPETGVDLTYIKLSGESDGAAGDKYNGLDRFGHIADQRWTTSGGTTKDRFQYGFDRNSNPLYKENLIDSTRSELFTYDDLNQLTTFQRGTLNGGKNGISGSPSRSQSWDFDALGNFEDQATNGTSQTRTHNKQNEITAISGATSPVYDANGNQTTDQSGRTFKFDAWNGLTEVKNSGGTTLVAYESDALGRRIQQATSGTTTDFYYSAAWQVLEERVSGTATTSYAWSPVYVDAMIARDRDTDANGSLDERLYPTHDANFNVTALINTSGTVVERFANDAYGTPTYFDASYGSRGSSNYSWNYLHQGLRWDGTTGKFWNRNRDFDPVQGRFTSNDPKGFGAGDVSFYRYEGNSAISQLDPKGLEVAADAHFYPLSIGGSPDQKVFPLTKAEHTKAHNVLREYEIDTSNQYTTEKAQKKWATFSEAKQKRIIRESMRAAKIEQPMIEQYIDNIMADATPGSAQARRAPTVSQKVSRTDINAARRAAKLARTLGVGVIVGGVTFTYDSYVEAGEKAAEKLTARWGLADALAAAGDLGQLPSKRFQIEYGGRAVTIELVLDTSDSQGGHFITAYYHEPLNRGTWGAFKRVVTLGECGTTYEETKWLIEKSHGRKTYQYTHNILEGK